MAFGQCRLDCGLAFQQPVQRRVELVLIDLAEAKHFAEARCRCGGRQCTGGGEFGAGFEDAADEQGEHEIAAAIAIGANDPVKTDLASGAEGRRDMAMRQAAGDGECIPISGDDGAALEHATQAFDMGSGPVGEITDRAFTNLPVLTIALTQQDGRRRVPVGNGFDIHGTALAQPPRPYKCQINITWLQLRLTQAPIVNTFNDLGVSGSRKFGLERSNKLLPIVDLPMSTRKPTSPPSADDPEQSRRFID